MAPGRSEPGRPVIGWYVHHHGSGHLTRLIAIRPHLDASVVVFSSLAAPATLPAATEWIRLERDDAAEMDLSGRAADPTYSDPTAGGALHWAPLRHRGHRDRLAQIATTVADRGIDAMVVDVSMEVTALSRLLGIPTIAIAQPGRRDDDPHRLGRSLATRIIAPWAAGMLDAPTTDTVEVGGISRFDGRERTRPPVPGTVLILGGRGGFDLSRADLDAAMAATPDLTWSALGLAGSAWVDDPWDALCSAEIIVSAAGQNSIADLAAVGARAIVLAQDRPFDEQVTTAAALARAGLAVVPGAVPSAPPGPTDWAALIAAARALDPDWTVWGVSGAAHRAATEILEVARPRPASTAVITLFSKARLDHVLRQAEGLDSKGLSPDGSAAGNHAPGPIVHFGVWLDTTPPPAVPGMTVLHVPPGDLGMRLAAGRNAGAAAALELGMSLLVFLDADCVPGPQLLERYEIAAAQHPDSLLCGPVTYLREDQQDLDPVVLHRLTSPHPARPAPDDDETALASAAEYSLFWSLSFAVTADTWRRSGGFHPEYQGYGAEDTDFGRSALNAGIPLVWVGGAHAYHQWHPTSSPPWAHLDDILRNATVFAERWGDIPMGGWLDAFAAEGAIDFHDGRWSRTIGSTPRSSAHRSGAPRSGGH